MINPYIHPKREALYKIFNLTEAGALSLRTKFLKDELNTYEEKLSSFLSLRLRTKNYQLWFVDDFIAEQRKQVNKHLRAIDFIKRRKRQIKDEAKGIATVSTYREYDREQAKQVSCRRILEEHGVEITQNKFKIRDERTPSCTLYASDSRWKDFGSQEGGDSIDLYMKLNGCDFITALRELQ